jgi:hypothetical protein
MLSPVASSILTLLNNIDELISISQDRESAQEVMRCMVVYAKDNNFVLPQKKIDNFYRICIDTKPNKLSSIIKDIAFDVAYTDRLKK